MPPEKEQCPISGAKSQVGVGGEVEPEPKEESACWESAPKRSAGEVKEAATGGEESGKGVDACERAWRGGG